MISIALFWHPCQIARVLPFKGWFMVSEPISTRSTMARFRPPMWSPAGRSCPPGSPLWHGPGLRSWRWPLHRCMQEVLHPVRHRGQSAVGDQFDIRGRGLGKLWGALRSEITALNHMFSDFGWLPEGCFPHHRLVGAQPLHQRVWRIL